MEAQIAVSLKKDFSLHRDTLKYSQLHKLNYKIN